VAFVLGVGSGIFVAHFLRVPACFAPVSIARRRALLSPGGKSLISPRFSQPSARKYAFLLAFSRFGLAFAFHVRYSHLRPECFRSKNGVVRLWPALAQPGWNVKMWKEYQEE
jgi:hypothetical protein